MPYNQESFGFSANVIPRSGTMIFVGTLFACAVFSVLNVKFNKRPSSSQCTDIISQLPDDILISIMARLPIKQATRMSILSTRWRYLPRSLSDICFHCASRNSSKPHDPNRNIDSVNRFLTLRSGSKIHNFRINCCLNNSVTQGLKQCIHSLGRSGLEQLVLSFCCHSGDSEFSFSCHLLSELSSLRYLELSFCTLQPSLRSHCSSLQMLILDHVNVPPGATECILSNCSSLQELVIRHSKCPSKICFRAPHLRLKYLGLGMCLGLEEIELYASNLEMFRFVHAQVVNFIFDHVPRLQAVYLDIKKEDVVPYVARKLAKDVPNLKSLNLVTRGDIYKGRSRLMGINTFTNLRRLDLTIYSVTDFPLVIVLLHSCPLIHELHLHLNVESRFDSCEAQGKKQATMYHSKLKKTEISGFSGTENEIELALYILKSATSLEEMRISRCVKIYMGLGWMSPEEIPWNEETNKMIHTRLQGQDVSNTAKVTIQYKANTEDHLWGAAKEYCPISFTNYIYI